MQLTIPQRTVADTDSFPVEPDGVSQWLSDLEPTYSLTDAREIYRGLRHSNRLHNDSDRRRSVIACFIPKLRELHAHLLEMSQAQPLPLTLEFQQHASLLDGLLREEAFAFKILLADASKPRADDVRRALQALVRQAEARVHTYKRINESILRDAHQLYSLAEEFSLTSENINPNTRSIDEHYRYILLLTMSDCLQHRVQQINPLFEFLKQNTMLLSLRKKRRQEALTGTDYLLHLKHGTRPVPAASLLHHSDTAVRWLDTAPLLKAMDEQIAQIKGGNAALLGSSSLDRQSLARLRVTLAQSRNRRSARTICLEPQQVHVGLKTICAHLHVEASMAIAVKASSSHAAIDKNRHAPSELENTQRERHLALLDQQQEDTTIWHKVNQSAQGASLVAKNCRAGLIQVGDIVGLHDEDHPATISANGKSGAMLGVVRWVLSKEKNGLSFGLEYLAKGVMPVGISRTYSDDIIAEDALIIACKVKDKVLQTMLLPAYLYQNGDRLTASLNGKSRNLVLDQSLQSNGLFSHFSLKDAALKKS